MNIDQCYQILNVTEQSTDDEIARSFKKLAVKYHPEKNRERKEWANETMKKVNQAYSTLMSFRFKQDISTHGPLKKQARKIIIKLKHQQLSESFMDELLEKLEANKDTVPYMVVIYTGDGYRITMNPGTGHGLKPTLAMKKDIETLTSENTVEILF